MIERDQALDILGSSALDFMERNGGGFTKENLNQEITNNICLYFLLNQRMQANTHDDISSMLQKVLNNARETNAVIKVFTDTAKEIFFESYDDKDALFTMLDVYEKLGNENIWDDLREYFIKYHKYQIGEI